MYVDVYEHMYVFCVMCVRGRVYLCVCLSVCVRVYVCKWVKWWGAVVFVDALCRILAHGRGCIRLNNRIPKNVRFLLFD